MCNYVLNIQYFDQIAARIMSIWHYKGRHTKKKFFLVVGPLRFYPPYTNGLVVHATFFSFFFSLIIAWNGFWQFFLFFPVFGLKQPDFREKKWFFAWWSGGFTLPTPLVVRPIKKHFFLCVSSLSAPSFIFPQLWN